MPTLFMRRIALSIMLLACTELTANGQALKTDVSPASTVQTSNVSAAPTPRNYISRYEIFAAPSYLTTPKLNLVQRGFNADFVININAGSVSG